MMVFEAICTLTEHQSSQGPNIITEVPVDPVAHTAAPTDRTPATTSDSSCCTSTNSIPATPIATPSSNEESSRELTQTDRLNFKLLTSFLERINSGAGPFILPATKNLPDGEGNGISEETESSGDGQAI